MKTGIELIAEERERQIIVECYTAFHDDKHAHGELAGAAACYAMNAINYVDAIKIIAILNGKHHHTLWPWEKRWWKPSTPIRDLVKAGALIAAEIDRLQSLTK